MTDTPYHSRKFYAGIGARKTPEDVQAMMTAAASQLEGEGLILRSGAADGADTAFERGVSDPDMKEIYLPWKGFNGHTSELAGVSDYAMSVAAIHHPAWNNLTQPVRKLMARNCHQIFGYTMITPVRFVLCWTPEGKGEGGTGQAIRVAKAHNIPVFDMGAMSIEEIGERLNTLI